MDLHSSSETLVAFCLYFLTLLESEVEFGKSGSNLLLLEVISMLNEVIETRSWKKRSGLFDAQYDYAKHLILVYFFDRVTFWII